MARNRTSHKDDDISTTSRSTFLSRNSIVTGFSSHLALFQSVKELLENAIDAATSSTSSSSLTDAHYCTLKLIQTSSSSGGFRITVTDTGDGFSRSAIAQVVTNVFSSTKGKPSQTSSSESISFGRYGIGVKAAILFAQETGVITPLTVTTCQSIDDSVSSARYGIETSKDAPLIVSLSYSAKEHPTNHGTTVSLDLNVNNNNDAKISLSYIHSYVERLIAFPIRKPALILELVNIEPKTPSRGTKRGFTTDSSVTSIPPSSLSASMLTFHSPGRISNMRDYLSSHFHVPIECISSSFDSTRRDETLHSSSIITPEQLQVQVAIVLTPPPSPPSSSSSSISSRVRNLKTLVEDARASGNETGIVHIIRYANSIPLLTSSAECSLTQGAIDSVQWGKRFGLALTPLISADVIILDEEARKTKKKKKKKKLTTSSSSSSLTESEVFKSLPRKIIDYMIQHPAARAFSTEPPQVNTSRQDAEGAYTARSAIPDVVTVPFSTMKIFINVSGSSLSFGDLKKTHILDDMTKAPSMRCTYLVAEAIHKAIGSLQNQLRQESSIRDKIPTQILESSRTANLRLLRNNYLPSIVSNLVKIFTQAGGVSSTLWKNVVQKLSSSSLSSAAAAASRHVERLPQILVLQTSDSSDIANRDLLEQPEGQLIELELHTTLLSRITRTLDDCIVAQDEAIIAAEMAEEESRAQEQLMEVFAFHSEAHSLVKTLTSSRAFDDNKNDPFKNFFNAFAKRGLGEQKDGRNLTDQEKIEILNDDDDHDDNENEDEVEDLCSASARADKALETALLAIQTHQVRVGQAAARKKAKLSLRTLDDTSTTNSLLRESAPLQITSSILTRSSITKVEILGGKIVEENEDEEEEEMWNWVPK